MNNRNHYSIVMTLLVIGLILAACAAPTPVAPTAAPTALPTTAPTPVPTVARPTPAPIDAALLANEWHWIGLTDPTQQIAIETPANYVLTFNPDGTVAIKAHCNNAAGTYTTDQGAMTITVGPMTAAACPPDSRSDQFVKLIGNAARYFIKDGNLLIDLKADGGTLTFASPAALSGDDSAGNSPGTTGALPADLTAQLDRWLQAMVSSEAKDPAMAAPGLVLLVDTPQGRYLKAAGVSNLEQNTPMKPEDRLQIGSNTKSMTIVLLIQLQEEGVLSLDDQLSKWLPEWAAKLPNGDNMTLRQIAQHTAGLWDYADDIIGGGLADPAKMKQSYTPAELMQYCVDKGKPYFAPGEDWHYSNCGYILLGLIAEKAAGQSLSELYQQRIFDPLGLKTAVLIEGVPQPGEITTAGYYWNNGQRLNVTNWNASQGWAAGANAMTAADLAAYGEALGAGQLFKQSDTLKQMLTFDNRSSMSVGMPYGLGLMDVGDGYWGHEGQTLGFQSLWFTNPDKHITVVGLSNSGNFSGFNFLNVLNILNQQGAQPLAAVGLLPLNLPVTWEWVQQQSPTGVTDIQPGTTLFLAKTGTATVRNGLCGIYANGTFTVDGDQRISFKFGAPEASCTTPGDAAKLTELLSNAAYWQFRDGMLAIELAADGGTLLFKVKM